MTSISHAAIKAAVQLANQQQRPLYLLVAATRPCFVKLASLVRAMVDNEVPHVLLLSGQHWDSELTSPLRELGYESFVSLSLNASGPMLERQGKLAHGLRELIDQLQRHKLQQPAIPIVSGDTWSAGFIPANWLMATGVRSVHVEAGLRSEGPLWETMPKDANIAMWQRETPWRRYINDPFPEGVCTRLASVACQTLLSPTQRNTDHLLKDGYEHSSIAVVGSLSADAVYDAFHDRTLLDDALDALIEQYPYLVQRQWLRVDLHRRENMRADRLTILLKALEMLSLQGLNIVLIETNAFKNAIQQFGLHENLQTATHAGVRLTPMWPQYRAVLAFMQSKYCLGIYTDSGGLQEEAHVIGVHCMTARYSTDRAETVLQSNGNTLVPLERSGAAVCLWIQQTLAYYETYHKVPGALYGSQVGEKIVDTLVGLEQDRIQYRAMEGLLDW